MAQSRPAYSPPWMTSSRLKSCEEVKASVPPPPRETEAGEYEVIMPAFPRSCREGWGGGFK